MTVNLIREGVDGIRTYYFWRLPTADDSIKKKKKKDFYSLSLLFLVSLQLKGSRAVHVAKIIQVFEGVNRVLVSGSLQLCAAPDAPHTAELSSVGKFT